jgi:hypothetical protein
VNALAARIDIGAGAADETYKRDAELPRKIDR